MYKLVVNIMTASNLKDAKLSIYMKQYLNEFNNVDILIKKLTNNNLENHKCISMYNHLNIPEVMKLTKMV